MRIPERSLGVYETAEAAHEAYMCAKRRFHAGYVEPEVSSANPR